VVEKRLLAVFIVTCALGLAVVLDLCPNYTCIVLFLALVHYHQNHHQKVFSWETTLVQGGLTF